MEGWKEKMKGGRDSQRTVDSIFQAGWDRILQASSCFTCGFCTEFYKWQQLKYLLTVLLQYLTHSRGISHIDSLCLFKKKCYKFFLEITLLCKKSCISASIYPKGLRMQLLPQHTQTHHKQYLKQATTKCIYNISIMVLQLHNCLVRINYTQRVCKSMW